MYVEHEVYGYILVARRVLYMAGSLRYRGIKHPWFKAHSVQCKNTPNAHCMHFSHVKYTCLRNIVAPTLQRICVETRVFYPTISQRSCSAQHSTFRQNVAIHSIFNIQEFQTAFSTLHCTVSKRILYGKSGYSLHKVCSYIAQNVRWITALWECCLCQDRFDIVGENTRVFTRNLSIVSAHCLHLLLIQYTCLEYNIVLKKQLKTLVLTIKMRSGCQFITMRTRT